MKDAKTRPVKAADEEEKTRLLVGSQVVSLLDQIIASTTISSRSQAASMLIGRMTRTFIQTWVYEFNPSAVNSSSSAYTPDLVLPDTQFTQHGAANPPVKESIDLEALLRPMEY